MHNIETVSNNKRNEAFARSGVSRSPTYSHLFNMQVETKRSSKMLKYYLNHRKLFSLNICAKNIHKNNLCATRKNFSRKFRKSLF